MARRVQFAQFGGPEVLEVVEQEVPDAGPGEVRVRVHAAGLNPVDWKIAADPQNASRFNVTLPAGNGNDFAGVVDRVGDGVSQWKVGDPVFGGARMHAQADYILARAETLNSVPDGMPIEQAACLDIAGRTATAIVRRMDVADGDTVLVSAAAGGVGLLVSQLCVRLGATVIGTASTGNHDFLRDLGVLPLAYGDGLIERIRDAAPHGVDIVLDHAGRETLDTAEALGIPADRINTIAEKPYGATRGFNTFGRAESTTDELRALAARIAEGAIVLPIAARYPIEQVRDAYERQIAGHVRGKIVLTLS
ncbi:NADP-dependent oxidoreductase [Paramicrobacterium agarici]|uniref:NADPH:quinone reductase-like Zn-dependent oxidoreductase n=1 Tax=Paramicrobacterium agarici TaxID=630514 RepID=A0A2A9DU71_9MICO|nr:NADP-dependent oxidoreductase [Microbacterium agarici]PFG30134.1 NADPH:quinone reductase-like Zn-dependent oxidoreductase [Microbacterium agarici]